MDYYRLTIKQDQKTMSYIVADVSTCLDVLKTYKSKDLIQWDIIPIKKVILRTKQD